MLQILVLLSLLVTFCQADIYVSPAGSDYWGNGTQGNPYQTIQYAIGGAFDDDYIILMNGTFSGQGNTGLDIDKSLTIISQTDSTTTIIDGSGSTIMSITAAIKLFLQGLTITNGYQAIITSSPSSQLFISNCVFKNSSYQTLKIGGGKAQIHSSQFLGNGQANGTATIDLINPTQLIISNSEFTKNRGVALQCLTSQVTILHSLFISNVGIQSQSCEIEIESATFAGSPTSAINSNSDTYDIVDSQFHNNTNMNNPGGAFYCVGSTMNFYNATFAYNTGGAGYCADTCSMECNECTLVDNTGNNGSCNFGSLAVLVRSKEDRDPIRTVIN